METLPESIEKWDKVLVRFANHRTLIYSYEILDITEDRRVIRVSKYTPRIYSPR